MNQGIYEWYTPQAAEFYSQSFAMQFMKRRSTPGSASYEIIPRMVQGGRNS